MGTRNPVKDRVAIVGVGTTEFARDLGGKTQRGLAAEACRNAILDAGLTAKDIDGMCGPPGLTPEYVQEGVGIPELTWWGVSASPVHLFRVVDALNAVFSGACDIAVAYQAVYRGPGNSRSAARDPFRARAARGGGHSPTAQFYMPYGGMNSGYAGWMARYLHGYGATREDFGLIAINERSNAALNDRAVLRAPITMEDYLAARMIREPMCLLDMDLPIDGGDALVITTAERARDLRKKPVYIHAAAYGQVPRTEEDQAVDLRHFGQQVAVNALWRKSDLALGDMDIFFPYDGFSIIAMSWIENVGYCARGEGGAFLRHHWDEKEKRVKVNGRVPFNTHGGALNEGANQGSGHLREAVLQLRGEAGPRQVPDCKAALVTPGGFFHNSMAAVLRAD
jgi:acetyl-CoA acetyltransferase